ncbi:glycosyltransferase [Acetobacter estunensis]|uniref:glycosyltransferase n=1 Tax=Acetobacter estunensis TaxID=104097 RepID=UPI001C2D0495|nr:glycosyltransferase [Acetobacter estunensis]MBV1836333.1 glycosyltransferase family 4 protein [Acetobacter estunensis]
MNARQPSPGPTFSPDSHVEGFLDLIARLPDGAWQIAGWVRRTAQTANTPVEVVVLCHGQELARARADLFREDLVVPGRADGHHGFDILIPDETTPIAEASAFDVLILPERAPLPRAAHLLVPTSLAIRGAVDVVGRDRLAGWLVNETDLTRRLGISVMVDGSLQHRVMANQSRPDLRNIGLGDGRYGFDVLLNPPLSADSDHVVSLICAENGENLPGSPFHVPATRRFNESFRSHVRQTLGSIASGQQREQAIDFLMGLADSLRQQQGRDDARETATRQHQLARRKGTANLAPSPFRVLFIDDRAPDPTRDAGSSALLSHMQAARALGYEPSFIASVTMPTGSVVRELEKLGITCWCAPTYPTVESLLRTQSNAFDAIVFHRLSNASRYLALASLYMPGARLVSSVADLASLRLERQSVVENRPELRTAAAQEKVREHMAAWASHATITHSPVEADLLGTAVPTASIHVVPWHIPLAPAPRPFADRSGIAFVAHYGHAPNLDAAKWLVEDILPHLRNHAPEAEILLVGSAMPDSIMRMNEIPGVQVLGHVADLAELLRSVRLTIAPLRFGAGIKGKVLESWAVGLPCVATPVAVEGLHLSDELKTAVVAGAAGLARVAADFYRNRDKADAIGEAGREYIRIHQSEATVCAALGRALGLGPRALLGHPHRQTTE